MGKLLIPAFGEIDFSDIRTNETNRVVIIKNAEPSVFPAYCGFFEKNGFKKRESRTSGTNPYASFCNETTGVFLNYFKNLREMSIVIEEGCNYFNFSDCSAEAETTPQLTQIHLEDFGMSEVIRLSDGRFIVFDGGWAFEPDMKRLMEVLEAGSPYEKPVIAAWILTHPHADHYHAFMSFVELYDVVIEKVLLNFPGEEVCEKYLPALKNKFEERCLPYVKGNNHVECIKILWETINSLGLPVFVPHTGQVYNIGNAKCEVLSCMDDTIHRTVDVNSTSLVIRMEIAGQVILWTADASFSDSRFAEKFGTYLKSDILQVPHHGFQSGTYEAEIEAYELIKPSVCLLEASEPVAYNIFCTFRKGTQYLMTRLGIDELITGEETRTLNLPYTAPSYGRKELELRYRKGRENAGARTWVFAGLNTSVDEDFTFSVLNMSVLPANIEIEMYFEKKWPTVRHTKLTIPGCGYKTVSVIDEKDVNIDAEYFNWETFKTNGMPENSGFALRFLSDIPVVISHKNHREAYKTTNE